MKKYIILSIILLLAISAKAQLNVSYSVGYGSYKMGDMKDLLEQGKELSLEGVDARMKITDKFPGYVTHSLDFTYQIQKHEFGLKLGYMTTGAKANYSDYSGKVEEKLILNGYKIGFVYKNHFYQTNIENNPFSLFVEIAPSLTLTDLTIKGELKLYEAEVMQKEKEKLLDSEAGFSLQPMVGGRLTLLKHLHILGSVGYDFEFLTKLGSSHRIDWSGFRLNAGIGYSF